jgi:hypothetical protein
VSKRSFSIKNSDNLKKWHYKRVKLKHNNKLVANVILKKKNKKYNSNVIGIKLVT